MYRPYVKYHAVRVAPTSCGSTGTRRCGTASTAWPRVRSPGGPFEIVEPDARVNGTKPGDQSLFVDDDGTAYLVYTDIALGHRVRVERLTSDWRSSTGEQSELFEPHNEATAMFKVDGTYFVTFGSNCCFCPEAGGGVRVNRATSPLGPYGFVTDINRRDDGSLIVPGQQTHVATLPMPSGRRLLWMADLWGSRPDGVKGHDLQHWQPLVFEDGVPRRLRPTATATVKLAIGS